MGRGSATGGAKRSRDPILARSAIAGGRGAQRLPWDSFVWLLPGPLESGIVSLSDRSAGRRRPATEQTAGSADSRWGSVHVDKIRDRRNSRFSLVATGCRDRGTAVVACKHHRRRLDVSATGKGEPVARLDRRRASIRISTHAG